MRFGTRLPILAGLIVACATIAVTAGAVSRGGAAAAATSAPSSGCHLGNGVKHVIEITFDNVHFNRDNPNVLSDLEQMPALQNFITSNGTMLSNNHTPLIAHTADDSITNYSGLYGDRQGQGSVNSYETYDTSGGRRSRGRRSRTGPARMASTRSRTSRTRRTCRRSARRRDAARTVGAVHARGLRRR